MNCLAARLDVVMFIPSERKLRFRAFVVRKLPVA